MLMHWLLFFSCLPPLLLSPALAVTVLSDRTEPRNGVGYQGRTEQSTPRGEQCQARGGSLRRACPRGSRGSKVRRRDSAMEGEQGAATPSSGTMTTNSNHNNNNNNTNHNGSSSSNSNGNSASSSSSTSTTTTTTANSSANSSANGGANSSTTSSSSSSSGAGRQTLPQISVYSGIPDRQTVQVIQQALHRQPSTAAQYLQQMYAAQQQHLMLQTAALQQQHLSTAQLQSLAAVQQASIAAGRQSTSSPQTGSSQATINLTTSPAAAQLISRAQSVSSAPAGISQQAVLLGNPTSPTLTASQAQMYLRAQMAQQSNLVQVARRLGRAVPLSPQLIFTPTATVTALQTDGTPQPAAAQVQNLAIRSQQGAVSTSSSSSSSTSSSISSSTSSSSSSSSTLTQTQALQALSLKQTPISIQPAALLKASAPGKPASADANHHSEAVKKSEGAMATEARAVNMSRSVGTVGGHPLIAPAYAHIQPHSLVKQQPQQFVIQQQAAPTPQRTVTASANATATAGAATTQLLQTASIQPHLHAQSLTVQPAGLTSHAPSSAGPPGPVPVLPKPASSQQHQQNQNQNQNQIQNQNQHHHHHHHHHHHPAPTQQATIFHSTVSPHVLSHHQSHAHIHGHAHAHAHTHAHAALSQAKAQPVQLTAINLQIHPTPNQASRLAQECKDKPTSLVVRESCPPHISQQPASASPQGAKPAEQPKTDTPTAILQTQGTPERVSTSPATPPPIMTSGNDCEAPAVVGSTAQNGENKPPQAIVKPQVLTHVIEGFVIQEGAEPFPMERPPIQNDSPKKPDQQLPSDPEKSPVHNLANNTDSEPEDTNQQDMKDQEDEPKLTCEFCGWVDFAYKFKGTKRFCSMVCAKRYNVGCTKRIGLFHPERTKTTSRWRRRAHRGRLSTDAKKQKLSTPQQTQTGSISSPMPSQPSQGESSPCSDMSSFEEPPSPLSVASSGPPGPQNEQSPDQEDIRGQELPLLPQHFLPCDPTKWNVEEVYEFIRSLPGCQEIADEFRSQEIDGQAMLLLKEDHLMSAMNIKLGPALKIYARISMLKDS